MVGAGATAGPETKPTPPAPTSDGAKTGVVAAVLSWLGFDAPKTTGALRGGDALTMAMNLWIIDADKPDRPARSLKIGQYRSPVFSDDGLRVFAVHDATIADIPVAAPDKSRELMWPYAGDPPLLLLGHGRDDRQSIAVLTSNRNVISLRPADGHTVALASSLPPADVATLVGHLGVCGDHVVYEAAQKSKSLTARTDVFIRPLQARLGKALTDAWPGSMHGQPAFSSDCKRIVIVSDEH